jgi:hypothetical protein
MTTLTGSPDSAASLVFGVAAAREGIGGAAAGDGAYFIEKLSSCVVHAAIILEIKGRIQFLKS